MHKCGVHFYCMLLLNRIDRGLMVCVTEQHYALIFCTCLWSVHITHLSLIQSTCVTIDVEKPKQNLGCISEIGYKFDRQLLTLSKLIICVFFSGIRNVCS